MEKAPSLPRHFTVKKRLVIFLSLLMALWSLFLVSSAIYVNIYQMGDAARQWEKRIGIEPPVDDDQAKKLAYELLFVTLICSCLFSLIGIIAAWRESLCLMGIFVAEKILVVVIRLAITIWNRVWFELWLETLPIACAAMGIFLMQDLYLIRFNKM